MKRPLRGQVDAVRTEQHQAMLENRLRKNFRRLAPRFRRSKTNAFRVYDWDIPEVRAVVDYYDGSLVVGEFVRWQTGAEYLSALGEAAAKALEIPPKQIYLKRRQTRPEAGARYRGEGGTNTAHAMEAGLTYVLRLDRNLDVGLFCDQRIQREELRTRSKGRSVLNLFSYTGSFGVSALAGGAGHVTSVDQSKSYLDWGRENLRKNQLPAERHEPVRSEVHAFLEHATTHGRRWDFIVVDPPSYSSVGDNEDFDILRDQDRLLQLCLRALSKEGEVWFSTNHQSFQPSTVLSKFPETTHRTLPEDFRKARPAHRSWRLTP